MADLVKPKEDGGCAGDEGTIWAPCSKFTSEESGKTEALEERERATLEFGSLARGNLTAAVSEEGASDTGEKAKLVSEAQTGPHWNNIGSITRGSPLNENDNWATFSPVATASSSLSIDTSNWAQNITPVSGEDPADTSNNQTVTTEQKNPDVSVPVSENISPGWQDFSFGGDPSWSESVMRGGDCKTSSCADTGFSPSPSVHRSDDLRHMQTSSLSTASPHNQYPPLTVFTQCFASSVLQNTSGNECEGSMECTRGWERLRDSRFTSFLWTWAQTSLHHPPASSCQSRLTAVLDAGAGEELGSAQAVPGSLVLPPGEEEKFDWTCLNHRRRSMSPDVVPSLFRPRKESLVDVSFDHSRAASGLAVLSEVELQQMCHEMESKFSRLSEELLTNLQMRDVMAGEMEAKNRFVSALLRVQQLLHTQYLNGGSGEAGRGKQWVWSHRKRDDEPAGMYLQTVIPYKLPKELKWRIDTLTQLTKVLKAIAEGSSTVPKLMSEYLQSEFLTSPVSDRHSFNDFGTSSDTSKELSTLTI